MSENCSRATLSEKVEREKTLAEQPFDTVEFPYLFLQAFGNKETTIKRLRAGALNKSDLGGVVGSVREQGEATGETSKALFRVPKGPTGPPARSRSWSRITS
jgi:hypothetical protein